MIRDRFEGGVSGSGHFSILPNLTNFGHFSPKMCQNPEKLTFLAKKWQFPRYFGAFGAENWSFFDFTPLLLGGHPQSIPDYDAS